MRQMHVRHGLRFHSLRGVDEQQRALAGRQAPADFVGEIDVPGGVEQIELVNPPSLAG